MKHLIILISILLLSSPVIGDYQTNGNKIRLRYLSGSNEHTRTSPAMDGSSKIDVKTFSLFFGEWGLTKSKLHHKGYWHEKDGTKTPHEEVNVNTYDLNFTFGSDLTLTLGILVFAEGDAIVYSTNGTYFKPKNKNPSFDGHLFGPLSSIYFGYSFGFLELVIGRNDSNVEFEGFECEVCIEGVDFDSQRDLSWGTYPNETTMIGIGIVF